MAKATIFPKTQEQVVQLEVKFKGALTKGQQVEYINELTTFELLWNYDHRLVFVNEAKAFFFLKAGFDGSLINHWEKLTSSTIIEQYNPNSAYTLGSIVHLNQKIYQCIANTEAGTLPNTQYWVVISGEVQTNRILLTNISEIIIQTSIKNPIFESIRCTFDPDVRDTDGQVFLEDPIYGECYYERIPSSDNNNETQAYKISFEENEEPFLFTGVVNVR